MDCSITAVWICHLRLASIWAVAAIAAFAGFSPSRDAAAQQTGRADGLAYLDPGTPAVGGVRHLVLIYAGGKNRVPWDAEKLLPYVAYVDRRGAPQDFLFDSFLWIEFATNDGVWLHDPGQGKRAIRQADWQWLLDAFFDPSHGVGQLEASVRLACRTLPAKDRCVNLVVTMPTPFAASGEFGAVTAGGPSLNFARDEDRLAALQWYIRSALARWKATGARQVRLAGFYWLAESIPRKDRKLVRQTADFLHSLGMKLYWIPYFGADGLDGWRKLEIDAAMLQPNYFFDPKIPPTRLTAAARNALVAGAGVELEVDGRASQADFRLRYPAYLDAGAKYGFMTQAMIGYYDGGGVFREFAAAKDPAIRDFYDQTYRFVKGTYRPVGTTPLPDLHFVRPRGRGVNLALAANGAKVTGDFVRGPGLEPERLIDGQYLSYGGSEGFAAFVWPGSFTVELPRTETISSTNVLLWDHDERTFRYQIEVSVDGKHWKLVVDKSKAECHGWQSDRFEPAPARYVRFKGLHNTINSLFQVVEFEVYR